MPPGEPVVTKMDLVFKYKLFDFSLSLKIYQFFHKHSSARRTNNYMQRIKGEDGEYWRETTEDVQDIIENYFSCLFKSSSINGRLTHNETVKPVTGDEMEELITKITYEEVKAAAFPMHPDKKPMHPHKNPGQHGLNPAFFQTFWSVVAYDVVTICKKFINTGELPVGINRMLVCLIPNVKIPQAMMDLRPLLLCNVLVRILSKVLSNRLKPCLGKLILQKESAFIDGRSLT